MLRRFGAALAVLVLLIAPSWGASTAQKAAASGSCPSASRIAGGPCNSLNLNFQTSLFWVQGQGYQPLSNLVSVTRASSHLCQYANGTWISVGNNVACITDQGFLIEEARTNKCTNFNANPPALVAMGTAAAFNAAVTNMTASGDAAALFGVVDDTAAITATGLQNVTNGRVYKIDNTAGVANAVITFGGTSGNVNLHTVSAYGRYTGASGANRIQMTGVASVNFGNSGYTRVSFTATPSSSGQQIAINAAPGAVVYFTLNVFEEGSFVTSPIITAGTSAARAADNITATGALLTALGGSAYSIVTSVGGSANAIGGLPRILGVSGGAHTPIAIGSSAGKIAAYNGSVELDATLGSGTAATQIKAAYGQNASGRSLVGNNGIVATDAGVEAAITSAQLGAQTGGTAATYYDGYIQRLTVFNSRLPDATLKALTQ